MSNNNNNDREIEQQRNSLEANKLLIKSFVEVLNKQDVTAVDKYYAPDPFVQQ
jgi:hypothetical protein